MKDTQKYRLWKSEKNKEGRENIRRTFVPQTERLEVTNKMKSIKNLLTEEKHKEDHGRCYLHHLKKDIYENGICK